MNRQNSITIVKNIRRSRSSNSSSSYSSHHNINSNSNSNSNIHKTKYHLNHHSHINNNINNKNRQHYYYSTTLQSLGIKSSCSSNNSNNSNNSSQQQQQWGIYNYNGNNNDNNQNQMRIINNDINYNNDNLGRYHYNYQQNRSMSFFKQFKDALNKEMETNSSFKDSLEALKKETSSSDSNDKTTTTSKEENNNNNNDIEKNAAKAAADAKAKAEDLYSDSKVKFNEKFGNVMEMFNEKVTEVNSKLDEQKKADQEESKKKWKLEQEELEAERITKLNTVVMDTEEVDDKKEEKKTDEEEILKMEQEEKTTTTEETNEEQSTTEEKEEKEEKMNVGDGDHQGLNAAAIGSKVGKFSKNFMSGLKEAWADLIGNKPKGSALKKKLEFVQPPEEMMKKKKKAKKEDGDEEDEDQEVKEDMDDPDAKYREVNIGGQLMIVKEEKNAWERISQRLKSAPLIQEILKTGRALGYTDAGKAAGKVRDKARNKVEDAQEVWETSQNPLVYKASSVWDDLTNETDLGIVLKEIRRIDRDFILDDWKAEIHQDFLPDFFTAYLGADISPVEQYLSEGVQTQLKAEISMRKQEGIYIDKNVLDIDQCEIVEGKMLDRGTPALLVGCMLQHVNCLRNKDGDIVDGAEDAVRATYYLLLFVREYNEEEAALEWKVSEVMVAFSEPFI